MKRVSQGPGFDSQTKLGPFCAVCVFFPCLSAYRFLPNTPIFPTTKNMYNRIPSGAKTPLRREKTF